MGHLVVVIGASGFLGQHLIRRVLAMPDVRVRAFCRVKLRVTEIFGFEPNLEIIEGSLLLPESLRMLLEPGCTVINLAYLWDAGEDVNLIAINNLLLACKAANVKQLIHCSTADVVGRTVDNPVTESTICRPITQYGVTKYKIEKTILNAKNDNFCIAILRPTAIFGPRGKNLKKLVSDLLYGNRFLNYLRSSLFRRRRMNLVHVDNVVEAIIFMAIVGGRFNGEIFIVSDDDCKNNNFWEIEQALMHILNVPIYHFPPVPFPLGILKFLLAILGRNNINPACEYSGRKLLDLGFVRPIEFGAGLADYAVWYRVAHSNSHFSAVSDARTKR